MEVSFGEETVTKDQVLTLTNTLSYTPTANFHPATKSYVDQIAQGIKSRTSALVLVDTNLVATYDDQPLLHELTADVNGAFPTTDGVDSSILNVADIRILLAGQTNAEENGLYVVKEIGDANNPWVLRRCTQCDTAAKIPGSYIFVTSGTQYANTGWILDVDDPTTYVLGTDDINVIQFAGLGTFTAGTGLDLDGTIFNLAPDYGDTLNPYGDKNANRVLAGPTTGSAALPTFRELVADDIPDIAISKVTNLQSGLDAKANSVLSLSEKTANHTIQLVDAGKVLIFDSASNLVVTVPLDSTLDFPVGSQIAFLRNGIGEVTFEGASGVDIRSVDDNLGISDQYGSAVLLKIAANEWQLVGSLL